MTDQDVLVKYQKTYEFLKKVRESKTVSLKPSAMLRTEIVGLDGQPQPFRLRYYQVQAIYHLLAMKRMVLGDAAGSGKTIVAIASCCYAWEKEPLNKVIIISPKSALRQWKSEIRKFAKNIKVYLVEGNLNERKAIYEAFAAHPIGDEKAIMVMGYALLMRDWNQGATRPLRPDGQPNMKIPLSPGLLDGITKSIPNLSVVYDECFEYHTPIILADGTPRLIGKIVCGKELVSVLSWNWETKTLETRQVIRWIRKPLRKGKGLVKITFRYANSIVATRDHKLYNISGRARRIRTLKAGAETVCYSNIIPSNDQFQIILGGLLGDASVSMLKRVNWGVIFTHGNTQYKYLQFKRNLLASLGTSEISSVPSGYSDDSIVHHFRLNTNPYLCSTLNTHENGKKHPCIDWLDLITPLGLAVWYADDGSLTIKTNADGSVRYTIIMNTQGFSKAENELLAGWLRWKWKVNARVIKLGRYHALYLNHETAVKFLELLPGSFPSVEYKFPNKPVLKDLNGIPNRGLVKDSIVNITFWKRATQKCVDYVYDLEVEGNHNYIANGTLVSNCTAFKNNRTKTWQVCRELSDRANRCYGMTATLLKNNLIEGFSIYKCIHPNVFSTKTKFLDTFCVTRMQPVAGGRKIPIVVGYRNLELFRMRIDPFFLGRPKHLISDELPTLVTREVPVKLSVAENTKYEEALSGVLSLGDGEVRNYEEHKRLVALIYCQQTVDSLSLLRYKEGDVIDIDMFCEEQVKVETLSSKEQALMDLLTEEFDNEKVIVYTRFASLIPRLQTLCKEAGILSTAITGKVTDTKKNPARQKAMEAFQDLNSKVRVIFISDAGSEAINLQAAEVLIAYNAPWSWGNYVQLLGRPIRIGSPHQHVIAIHLVAERPSKKYKTIDHYALEILHRKKNLIDKVLGESAVGALDFESEGSFTFELMKSLRKSGVE